MTVYFIHRISDDSQIKIGSSTNIAARLRNHAASFGDIKLFAQCAGGVETERLYQKAFAHLRTEGEWFTATNELRDFIAQNAEPVDTVFLKAEQGWLTKPVQSKAEEDGRIAAVLMRKCVEKYPATMTIAATHEALFLDLHEMTHGWTRRRVRSLYESRALRVDLFEIIDLLNLAGVSRSEWADTISPQLSRPAAAVS
jgi:hypothetical protein